MLLSFRFIAPSSDEQKQSRKIRLTKVFNNNQTQRGRLPELTKEEASLSACDCTRSLGPVPPSFVREAFSSAILFFITLSSMSLVTGTGRCAVEGGRGEVGGEGANFIVHP